MNNKITAVLTSCGRYDLLEKTISSLEKCGWEIDLFVYEDDPAFAVTNAIESRYNIKIHTLSLGKKGQHGALEYLISLISEDTKYVLFLEDDWEFNNWYDWIKLSIEIMEHDSEVIKVLARIDSPHPCNHSKLAPLSCVPYGELGPWVHNNILWHGFSWNPGVTRVDLLRQFIPFPRWEQQLAERIYYAGYKTAETQGVYKHIGDGRSTHQ